MSSLIVGLSGRKQSGKNTAANYGMGMIAEKEGFWKKDEWYIMRDGTIATKRGYFNERVAQHVKIYSYADSLKETCINLFGLTHEQCYGSNEQKNSLTNFRWENMPGYPSISDLPKSGLMTAREFIQYLGTDICRKFYNDIWIDHTFKKIKKDAPKVAFISDVRFPNEVIKIKEEDGVVVRLTAIKHEEDSHDSETSLDPEVFDWENFDAIIRNQGTSLKEGLALVDTTFRLLGVI